MTDSDSSGASGTSAARDGAGAPSASGPAAPGASARGASAPGASARGPLQRLLAGFDALVPGYRRYRKKLPWPLYPLLRWYAWRWHWGQEAERVRASGQGEEQGPLWGSERAVLTEALVDLSPFDRVLEVGCGYGQSLYMLAPLFPQCAFVGVDRNAERIRAGMELFEREKFHNVQLVVGAAERLSELPEKSFDVVFTSACLLYIAPSRIEPVLSDLLRIAVRGVVLLELQSAAAEGDAVTGEFVGPGPNDVAGYYVRDYRQLLRKLAPQARITERPIGNPRWPTEQWKSRGRVVMAIHPEAGS